MKKQAKVITEVIAYYGDETLERDLMTLFKGSIGFEDGLERAGLCFHGRVELPEGFRLDGYPIVCAYRDYMEDDGDMLYQGVEEFAPLYVVGKNSVILKCVEGPSKGKTYACKVLETTMKKATEYMSATEAAEMLGVSRMRVNQLIHDGKLEAVKMGKVWAVLRESVESRLIKN